MLSGDIPCTPEKQTTITNIDRIRISKCMKASSTCVKAYNSAVKDNCKTIVDDAIDSCFADEVSKRTACGVAAFSGSFNLAMSASLFVVAAALY